MGHNVRWMVPGSMQDVLLFIWSDHSPNQYSAGTYDDAKNVQEGLCGRVARDRSSQVQNVVYSDGFCCPCLAQCRKICDGGINGGICEQVQLILHVLGGVGRHNNAQWGRSSLASTTVV